MPKKKKEPEQLELPLDIPKPTVPKNYKVKIMFYVDDSIVASQEGECSGIRSAMDVVGLTVGVFDQLVAQAKVPHRILLPHGVKSA